MDTPFFLTRLLRSVLLSICLSSAMMPAMTAAQETVCAEVKIEIAQELTIERQAFEATLKIENTLADKTLSNIKVLVEFKDDADNPVVATNDPDDTTADFFIRVNHLEGINDISGSGSLDGGKTANASWLIIPAHGASDGIPSGKLYFVGASFQYQLDGVDGTIEVAPDAIYVKPMPLLSLDYFLPRDVFADNPLTTAIEPPEPFTLGVRVKNNGSGSGRNIKIESAQPQIVENQQGLLIDFKLLHSQIQNQSVNNSLLVEFGDLPAQGSKVARWTMQTSLSGRFKDFTAEYTHADELGGELTSLLESVNTHTLLRDVLVDIPGRDGVQDFLAYEGFDDLAEDVANNFGDLNVYESDSTSASVTDQSNSAVLGNSGNNRSLSFTAALGFVYAQVDDPFKGSKRLSRAIRSDGKELNLQNVWFSKSYDRTTKEISYHLNLFDHNSSGQYILYFIAKEL